VPLEALQGDPANRVVYVKDFDLPNTFVKCPVQVGERNDRYVEIISGLFPGDEVVTKGSYFLGFVAGGGPSLKDALDAAHGHPHNEDGSIMTAEQLAAQEGADDGHAGHAPTNSPLLYPLALIAIVSIVLLIVSGIKIAQAQKRIRELEGQH
jgi:cobalt-zinc-cadmium efflux system membrane fusion protein